MPQRVLITGSSSGFGKLITETLLRQGHTVFATMRGASGKNQQAAEALREYAADQPGTVHIVELDVSDDASVEHAVAEILAQVDTLNVVVNNAGYGTGGVTEAFTSDQLTHILDVNVTGVHRVNRAVLPAMREAGAGLLIHISSVMGRLVIPFAGAYTASKYALEGLAESYRYELAPTGVDVCIIEPGGFGTNFLENMQPPEDEARVTTYGAVAQIPEQMWGGVAEMLEDGGGPDPQELADAVRDLIETPAGERPFRVVVDPMSGGEGPRAINQTTDQVQDQLLTGFGIGHLKGVQRNA